MWFNVLKTEERRAAYQDFLNALGLGPDDDLLDTSKLGEVETYYPNNPSPVALTIPVEPGQYIYRFFYSIYKDEVSLIVSNQYEPYEDFVFNLFKEEYPRAFSTIQRMFLEKKQEIEEEQIKNNQMLKFQRYMKDGYNVSARDITIRPDGLSPSRVHIQHLLVESQEYLRKRSPTMNVLRMPMKSYYIDKFLASLQNNDYDTSLAELVETIHEVFNHSGGSVHTLMNTGTREDYYLDLIERLRYRGLISLKKDMLLLLALKEEEDDDLSSLFA